MRGRVRIDQPLEEWVVDRREVHGLVPLAIDEHVALHLLRLPAFQRDLFDRIFVAHAFVHGVAIRTPDPAIRGDPVRATRWAPEENPTRPEPVSARTTRLER